MEIKIDDFFKPINLKGAIPEETYGVIPTYINAADAFARTTYRSIYLVDYFQRGFLYVSDNPLFLCGLSPQEVKRLGFAFYLQQVPENDLKLLLDINVAGFLFFKEIPIAERLNYTISYDFHLKQPNDKTILIHHKLTPLLLDENGQIWVSLCIVSLSAQKDSGNIEIRKKGNPAIYEFDRKRSVWIKTEKAQLSDKEKEILLLSAQGLTVIDISNEIFISPETIKFHKRNIFEKLGVNNIREAIMYAVSYGII